MNAEVRSEAPELAERVLVFVKGQREARLTFDLLTRAGFSAHRCESMAALCVALEEGAGVVLVAEELLTPSSVRELRAVLDRQPPWSDLPIVTFGRPGELRPRLAGGAPMLGNVTYLDRPVRVRSMLASIQAAIGSRRRQYDARRAIASRDAFLAMLGHELRNPLGAISLAANLLRQNSTLAKQPREYAILVRQTAHLTRIVDDLLDVARFTHGKIPVRREEVDLSDILRGTFEALRGRAEEHGLDYQLVAPDTSTWVDGDRQRLEQVFANLITNAIKYTLRGGSVIVTVRQEAKLGVVEVKDSGIGLTEDAKRSVFDPFTQVDASLDRADGGLGLGLSIVHAVVKLHGGSVEAHSEGLGRGSSFIVRMPRLSTGSSRAPEPPPPTSRPMTRQRIVLVEDQEDLRELFCAITSDHDVVCAEDGPSGLEKIVTWQPEIAFVDIGLPGFDGFEVARRARSLGFVGRLVALTGYGQATDRHRALEAGFNEHLVKPVLEADITRAIEQAAV